MDDDEREFEEFVRDVEPRLRRAFLGSRGVDGAADAVSEAMAYAWEHWSDVRAMDNPAGYLYRVGQSRTRARKVAALPPPATVGLPDIEPALIPALLALPETQRTAIWLVHACARTYVEAATALERSATARVDAPPHRRRDLLVACAAAIAVVAIASTAVFMTTCARKLTVLPIRLSDDRDFIDVPTTMKPCPGTPVGADAGLVAVTVSPFVEGSNGVHR